MTAPEHQAADHPPVLDLDRLVDLHADTLFAYAVTRLRSRDDAEDAVQETLLAAITAQHDFRGESADRTWLIGILRHKIVDRIRQRVRSEQVLDTETGIDALFDERDRWAAPPQSWGDRPDRAMEQQEFWLQLERCVDGLPKRQAQVFLRRTLDDQDSGAVCKELGISATNLWVLLHRARIRLRACLEAHWFTAEENRS